MFNTADVEAYLKTNVRALEALGLEAGVPLTISLLARGEYNLNYSFGHPKTGKQLLFRVNLGSQLHLIDQVSYEATALDLLRESGRAPQLHFVDDSKSFFGHGILIEDFLPGRPLSYETDLDVAAEILADIHSVSVPEDHGLIVSKNPLIDMLDECAAMFKIYRDWVDADITVVQQIDHFFRQVRQIAERNTVGDSDRDADRSQRHIINTELNSRNFLINEGGQSYLVDWEKPLVGAVEQDLAHFLSPVATFWKTEIILGEQQRQDFVQRYCLAVANRFDTTAVPGRINDFLAAACLRGITWAAMALAEHRQGIRQVADEYTLGKIETYLTVGFHEVVSEFFAGEQVRAVNQLAEIDWS